MFVNQVRYYFHILAFVEANPKMYKIVCLAGRVSPLPLLQRGVFFVVPMTKLSSLATGDIGGE